MVEESPPQMIVKRFGCTAIHSKELYKWLIYHSFIPRGSGKDYHIRKCVFSYIHTHIYFISIHKRSNKNGIQIPWKSVCKMTGIWHR